jgi:FKBP-type peptidyl-prolyl cis-trans isomerase
MKKNLKFLAVLALGLAGCKGGFKQGDGGMLYNIVSHGSGSATIKEGDFVALQGIIKTEGDSLLSSTYDMGGPKGLMIPKPQFKGDLPSALMLLSEGDSAIIKSNLDTLIKKTPGQRRPPFKGKYIIYYLKIEKVIAKGTMTDAAMQDKIKAYYKGITDKTKAEEPAKISKYIADNKLNTTKTATGLNYVITTPGSGPNAGVGDTVVVSYVGRFTTGKTFDTNVKEEAMKNKATYNPMNPYKPARIPVGVKAVIPGWDEGLLLLNKGAKATFVIPSSLAYGEQGGGPIPPFSPLVFDVTIVDIVHPNPNAPKPVVPAMPQAQQQAQPQVKK